MTFGMSSELVDLEIGNNHEDDDLIFFKLQIDFSPIEITDKRNTDISI